MRRAHLALVALFAAACGSGASGTPLRSGSVTGSYDGRTFTAAFGFAATKGSGNLIAVGAGPLNCDTPNAADPPAGSNGIISVKQLAVGSYANVNVQVMTNDGDWMSFGSNSGTLTITAADDHSVAGTISFTENGNDHMVALNGDFDVERCPAQ